MLCMLTFCWFADIALWAVIGILTLAALLIAILLGGDLAGPTPIFLISASLIREWAFGFPQLVLQPPADEPAHRSFYNSSSQFCGKEGITVSPLRPSGEVQVDGKTMSCISENGKLIETGEKVVVAGERNGRLYVRAAASTASK